uniref:alkaline phosphatase D family protein n=1 Tax=Dankookia rubra TaxID=1442381 RepID=UPI0019D62481
MQTLEDYRRRYVEYHMDPDLMSAHAAHPFVCSFDDHEVDNNWAGAASEGDGRSARHPVLVPPEVFALRKAAAFQAWYEAMPVRAALLPRGPEIIAFRRLRFGRLLDLHVLDTRSHRDDQPCGDVTGPPCAAVARLEAQVLGAAQEGWLLEGLGQAIWQVLAQQVMLMRREFPRGAISMGKWDAYPAARTRLLRGLHDRCAANAVVLSGDVHNAWAGSLRLEPLDERSPVVATEFTGTSITSEGDGSEVLAGTAEVLRRNPHIAHFNSRRGYTLHEATAARLEVTFRAVRFVTRPDAPREDRGRFVVEAGKPGVTPG